MLEESFKDMALFGRRKGKPVRRKGDAKSAGAESSRSNGSRKLAPEQTIEHRLTRDLSRAETLATMLAQSRAARVVEVADLLAAMYIYDWEQLSKYWEDQDRIEEYLQQICRISPQRWHHWIQFYDQQRQDGNKAGPWKWLRPSKILVNVNKNLAPSAELRAIFQSAAEIAPAHDLVEDRMVPILTCACVLLAMARKTDSEIGHRLISSGIDLHSLEQAARNPRHAPLH
jgi:hypothetical protein